MSRIEIMMKSLFFIFWVALGMFPLLCSAQEQVPTTITSDEMRYYQKGKKVLFVGNVQVERPEIMLWSDRLTVFLHKKDQPAPEPSGNLTDTSNIEKIVAEGNVRFKKGEREGSCNKATYKADEKLLIMEGDAKLIEGKNEIQGKIIRFYLDENKSEVTGGEDGRVKARFFTAPMDEGE